MAQLLGLVERRARPPWSIIPVVLRGRARRSRARRRPLAERDPVVRVLIDETELGAGYVGPRDIGRIADAWQKAAALHSIRIAAFASNPVIYGLNRMFQGLAKGAERVSVFHDNASART